MNPSASTIQEGRVQVVKEKRPIRVLCVDDHPYLAEGLEAVLAVEADLEFVGRLSSAEDLLMAIPERRPDIVLLDIEMPGPDPFEVMAEMQKRHPDVRTIILSGHVRDHYIGIAMDRGAYGYFSKSDSPRHLIEGIRKVAGDEKAFGEEVEARLQQNGGSLGRSSGDGKLQTKLQTLTPRELEILRMIGKGMCRADIARSLYRSPKTVDAHHTSIMKKLGIHDRAELTRFAIREGLVEA